MGQQAMPTSDDVLAYNGYTGSSQDGDKGVFMMLNGSYSDYPMTWVVLSPKVSLEGAVEPVLRLWLYKGNQSGNYAEAPTLAIAASSNEADFVELGVEKWDDVDAPTWVECTYPLNMFVGDPHAVIFQLVTTLSGMSDIMLIDNFRVEEKAAAGINGVGSDNSEANAFGVRGGILTRGAAGKTVDVFTTSGVLVESFTGDDTVRQYGPGIYIVSFGGRAFKVVVR